MNFCGPCYGCSAADRCTVTMQQKPENQTAIISGKFYCKECGWPLVIAACNDAMRQKYPNDSYRAYCSNQGCEHHGGAKFNPSLPPNFAKKVS